MGTLMWSDDEQQEVFRIVAAILHLGNIRFCENDEGVKISGRSKVLSFSLPL